jgi:hypothetical protein
MNNNSVSIPVNSSISSRQQSHNERNVSIANEVNPNIKSGFDTFASGKQNGNIDADEQQKIQSKADDVVKASNEYAVIKKIQV